MAIKINGQRVLDVSSNDKVSIGPTNSEHTFAYSSTLVGNNLLTNRSARFLYNLDQDNTLIGNNISGGYALPVSGDITYNNISGSYKLGSYKSLASDSSWVTYGNYTQVTIKFKVASLGNLKVGFYGGGTAAYSQSTSLWRGISLTSGGNIAFKTIDSGFVGGNTPYSVGSVIEITLGVGIYKVLVDNAEINVGGADMATLPYLGAFGVPIFTFGTAGMEITDVVVLSKAFTSTELSTLTYADNTFIGKSVASQGIAITSCVGIGKEALKYAVSLTDSVVIGNSAAETTTTAAELVALGHRALYGNTTGSSNVAVGPYAGQQNTTGYNNTYIGKNTGVGVGNITGNNISLIGYQATPSANTVNNQVTLGNASITSLRCAVTSITSLSDSRDKKDIAPLIYGIDFVNALNPVAFTWNSRDGSKVGIKSSGFLAQDLKSTQDSFNAADTLNLVHDVNPDKLEATYGNLIPVLVKAVQELSQKVSVLEAQLAA
jgi:hypothetical protein